jgi:hypothetical protein
MEEKSISSRALIRIYRITLLYIPDLTLSSMGIIQRDISIQRIAMQMSMGTLDVVDMLHLLLLMEKDLIMLVEEFMRWIGVRMGFEYGHFQDQVSHKTF